MSARTGTAAAGLDEEFVPSASPPPAEVRPAGSRRAAPESGPPARGFGTRAWSAFKLLAGLAVVIGASSAVAFGAYRYAMTTPRFAITELEVVGARRLGKAELMQRAGLELGHNIFAFDTERAARAVAGDPWVKQARITRRLPSSLRLEVVEHEARALAALGDDLYLVTRDGLPFKQLAAGDPFDLPIITGLSAENLARDRQRELDRVRLALEIQRHYERSESAETLVLQEIHLAAGGDARLQVGRQGLSLHLGKGPYKQKIEMAERVLSKLRRKGRTPSAVFLDNQAHPERVVVRMR